MPQTLQQPVPTIQQKVLNHIRCSHVALEKAAAQLAAYEQQQEEIKKLIPDAIKCAVSGERIEDTAEEREKLAAICKDPVQLVRLFCKVAVHRNAAEHALGEPVDTTTKTAGAGGRPYDSLNDPRVGVRTTRVKQSSQRLFQRLGLNQPTEG